MAKLVPMMGEMSGSVGNCVFSHNKGGAYVRRRAIPTNPNSVRQQAIRAILTTLSSNWASLTALQRNQWNEWAAANPVVDPLGVSFQRTGQQAYVGLNSRVLSGGGAAVAVPPVALAPAALTTSSVACAAGVITVTFTPTPLGANLGIAVWHTPPGSQGQTPNQKQARLAGYSAAAAASPATVNAWVTPLATQQIQVYVSVIRLTDGQVSQSLRSSVICT
jgi:hypothetical protein